MGVKLYADLIILFCHLVVAENYAKWLPKYDIKQPPKHVVHVSRYIALQLSLNYHYWHINHHNDERNEIYDTENSNNQILVENGGD